MPWGTSRLLVRRDSGWYIGGPSRKPIDLIRKGIRLREYVVSIGNESKLTFIKHGISALQKTFKQMYHEPVCPDLWVSLMLHVLQNYVLSLCLCSYSAALVQSQRRIDIERTQLTSKETPFFISPAASVHEQIQDAHAPRSSRFNCETIFPT